MRRADRYGKAGAIPAFPFIRWTGDDEREFYPEIAAAAASRNRTALLIDHARAETYAAERTAKNHGGSMRHQPVLFLAPLASANQAWALERDAAAPSAG